MKTKAYACYNKNSESRENSSSGGVFVLLAEVILKKDGVIFAVCYDDNFETVHREIQKMDDLAPSLGSKYIPSRLNDSFSRIKKYLLEGRWVLFVGTPCQCEGLRAFLGKDYNTLLLVDFVCHGVPSRVAWRKFLEQINTDGKLTELNMRDKSSGWSKYQYNWRIRYNNNKNQLIPQKDISYMKGFASDYYLRPSCYECRFKGTERGTDITLGDYWGVWDIQPEMDDNKGTSLVLIHSDKGKHLLEKIQSQIKQAEAPLEKAIQYNKSIVSSATRSRKREQFFEKLQAGESFDKIIKELSQQSLVDKVKRKGKTILKKMFGIK